MLVGFSLKNKTITGNDRPKSRHLTLLLSRGKLCTEGTAACFQRARDARLPFLKHPTTQARSTSDCNFHLYTIDFHDSSREHGSHADNTIVMPSRSDVRRRMPLPDSESGKMMTSISNSRTLKQRKKTREMVMGSLSNIAPQSFNSHGTNPSLSNVLGSSAASKRTSRPLEAATDMSSEQATDHQPMNPAVIDLMSSDDDEPARSSAAEGRRLYIGNLAYGTTEAELNKFFEGYPVYVSPEALEQVGANTLVCHSETISVPTNPRTARPVGYAFVEVSNPSEANCAIQNLSGKTFMDRNVSLHLAREPEAAAPKRQTTAEPQDHATLGNERGKKRWTATQKRAARRAAQRASHLEEDLGAKRWQKQLQKKINTRADVLAGSKVFNEDAMLPAVNSTSGDTMVPAMSNLNRSRRGLVTASLTAKAAASAVVKHFASMEENMDDAHLYNKVIHSLSADGALLTAGLKRHVREQIVIRCAERNALRAPSETVEEEPLQPSFATTANEVTLTVETHDMAPTQRQQTERTQLAKTRRLTPALLPRGASSGIPNSGHTRIMKVGTKQQAGSIRQRLESVNPHGLPWFDEYDRDQREEVASRIKRARRECGDLLAGVKDSDLLLLSQDRRVLPAQRQTRTAQNSGLTDVTANFASPRPTEVSSGAAEDDRKRRPLPLELLHNQQEARAQEEAAAGEELDTPVTVGNLHETTLWQRLFG